MRFKLQERKPYQESLRWRLNSNYFQERGEEAFLSRDVPYEITSNPVYAHQVAQVVLTAFEQMPETEPLRVLELGAGLGGFAFHFFQAFQAACETRHLPFAERLEYWMTDFSDKTVQSWLQNPVFQPYLASGQLRIGQLDALNPLSIEIQGQTFDFPPAFFSALVANYHHCVLPVGLMLCKQSLFFEVETEVYAWLAGSPQQPASPAECQAVLYRLAEQLRAWQPELYFEPVLAQALAAVIPPLCHTMTLPAVARNWEPQLDLKASLVRWLSEACLQVSASSKADLESYLSARLPEALALPLFSLDQFLQKDLQDIHSPRAIELETYCPSDVREVLLAQNLEEAVLTYPLASISSLQALLPILKSQGVLLISDKGYFALEQQGILEWPVPSYHGGSMAHLVNFPFLSDWLARLGCGVLRTQDPSALIQTLLAVKQEPLHSALEERFQNLFMMQNKNNLHMLLLQAGVQFYQHQKYQDAIRYYWAAHQLAPQDETSLLFLASSYLLLKQYTQALRCLELASEPAFISYPRTLLKAEIYFRIQNYAEAIEGYQRVLGGVNSGFEIKSDKLGLLYLSLGESYLKLQQLESAQKYLEKAGDFLPEHPELERLLALPELAGNHGLLH